MSGRLYRFTQTDFLFPSEAPSNGLLLTIAKLTRLRELTLSYNFMRLPGAPPINIQVVRLTSPTITRPAGTPITTKVHPLNPGDPPSSTTIERSLPSTVFTISGGSPEVLHSECFEGSHLFGYAPDPAPQFATGQFCLIKSPVWNSFPCFTGFGTAGSSFTTYPFTISGLLEEIG